MSEVVKYREKARRDRRHCLLLLLDVKNAFNTIRWNSVIRCMREREFEAELVTFIRSYLSERQVVYKGKDYDLNFQVFGRVPQGSVIGPLLWNLVYDDLLRSRIRRDVHLIGYADDIGIVIVDDDLERMRGTAEKTIQDMGRWYEAEGLTLTHHKTEATLLTGRKTHGGLFINCGGTIITPKREAKYLGVIMERNSKYREHIVTICSKAIVISSHLF